MLICPLNFSLNRSDIIKDDDECDAANLPLIIRERDTEYQFRRIVLFRRLLEVSSIFLIPLTFSIDYLFFHNEYKLKSGLPTHKICNYP